MTYHRLVRRTRFVKRLLILITLAATTVAAARAEERSNPLRLTLPTNLFAVAGTRTSIYFDNVILSKTPERFRFEVECDLGVSESRRWTLEANPNDVGRHALKLRVHDDAGNVLAAAQSTLHVVPSDAGVGQRVRLLIVGDSLTHATQYPNDLARRLAAPGNPEWEMLGTHQPKNAADGVRHEGYGGWTWQRFVSRYEPNPDGTHRKRSSPFVFLNAKMKPELNVEQYFKQHTKNERPDVVFFLLGINDCFSAKSDDLKATDARIDQMLVHANRLLEAFRKAAPDADLVVCITTPPNARESGFEANYKGRYHRWGWKRIQHRLVERLIADFQTPIPTKNGIGRTLLAPTHLNLDPVDGYPVNNGVHPNATGYQQIGGALYAWLKWRMTK